MEGKYNCKIQWKYVQSSDYYKQLMETVNSGQNFADIVTVDRKTAFPDYVNKDIIIPLDDYINFSESGLYGGSEQNVSLWRGSHYGVTSLPYVRDDVIITYNKNLIQKEGLTEPYLLLKDGQWTWDRMEELCIKTTKDTNGDGTVDQWGIEASTSKFITQMIYSNGGDYLDDNRGIMRYAMNNNQVLKTLDYIQRLYNVDKVVKEQTGQPVMFNSGKAAMTTNITLNQIVKNFTVGYVVYPKGPDVRENIISSTEGYFYSATPL